MSMVMSEYLVFENLSWLISFTKRIQTNFMDLAILEASWSLWSSQIAFSDVVVKKEAPKNGKKIQKILAP